MLQKLITFGIFLHAYRCIGLSIFCGFFLKNILMQNLRELQNEYNRSKKYERRGIRRKSTMFAFLIGTCDMLIIKN